MLRNFYNLKFQVIFDLNIQLLFNLLLDFSNWIDPARNFPHWNLNTFLPQNLEIWKFLELEKKKRNFGGTKHAGTETPLNKQTNKRVRFDPLKLPKASAEGGGPNRSYVEDGEVGIHTL